MNSGNKYVSRRLLCVSVLFAFVCCLSLPGYAADECSAASFQVSTSLTLQTPPYAVATADFNGDGHPDLAATNNTSNEVVILLGRGGAEAFGPPVSFPTGTGPEGIIAADFNADGKADLLTSNNVFGLNYGTLSVLLGDGNGNFAAPRTITLTDEPYQPLVSDLNNDGKLDLVVILYTGVIGGKIAILLGDGNGGFTNAPNSPFFPNTASPSGTAIGDFNEDGKRDLALSGNPNIDVLYGDGAGGFAPAVSSPTNNYYLGSLVAADFNGDGHLDLLGSSSGVNSVSAGNLHFLPGDGTGSFGPPTTFPANQAVSNIVVLDINADGKLDISLTGLGSVKMMLGDGTGAFTPARNYAVGPGLTRPAFNDYNSDGKLDLAIGQGLSGTNYSIEILYGDGSDAFVAPLSFSTGISRPRELITADFNLDGKQDFVTVSGDYLGGTPGASSVGVALGDGSGGFTEQPLIRFFSGTLVASVAAADFNRDGKLDLIATLPSSHKVAFMAGDGSGAFPVNGFNAPTFSTYPAGFYPTKVKAADVNADGNPDLVALTPNSNNFVTLLGDGAGNFTTIQGPTVNSPRDIAVADFNSDGKADLVISGGSAGSSNVVSVFFGAGNGTFSSSSGFQSPSYMVGVIAADFNADGKPDFAVSSSYLTDGFTLRDGFITVYLNDGAGGHTPGNSYALDGPGVLGSGDFNGDGKLDLVSSSGHIFVGGTQNGVSILSGDGAGHFASPVSFSAGSESDYPAVNDFNSDGKPDVLFTQPNTYSVALLLNNFSAAQPCLSVTDATVTETDAGTTAAVFTVKLSAASAQTVRVNYYFETPQLYGSYPARKNSDFVNTPGTLTFAPGVTTQTVAVPVNGDTTDEFDEFYYLRLTTPINAFITDSKGVGMILDNDAPPAININDVSAAEGNQFTPSSAVFALSLSAASEKPVDVQYALLAGTATANTDYSNSSGVVEFPAGVTSKTLAVALTPDNVYELDETFFVNLSNAANAALADGQGQATIINDDPLPGISVSAFVYRTEGAAGTSGNAVFEVKLSNPSSLPITVAYSTADGTATAGNDYNATSGSLTFNPGETTKIISVAVNGDNVDEIDETFFVNLTNPTNANIAAGQGTGTILDDDGPTINIGDATVTEGNTGTVNANFTVTLSAPSPQDVFVRYATSGGTATANVDYVRVTSSAGGLTIPAGATSGTITIRVNGDYQIEPDETFFVLLSSSINGSIVDGQALCTIVNDDAPGTLQFSAPAYSAGEGNGSATVTVSRTGGGGGTVTVDFTTLNGTATAGSDYTAATGTLTLNQGELSKNFTIQINDDPNAEGDETINLLLSNPTGGASLGSQTTAQLTILDNDASAASSLQFSAANFDGSENNHSATITVTRTGDTANTVTVDYVTSDGTAKKTTDYTVATGTLKFNAGETTKTFAVLITDNAYVDGSRTVQLSLSNPTSGIAMGTPSTALLTITDNDTTTATTNPIDEAQFFVRQNYADFLSREPDQGGLDYWTERITQCGTSVTCVNFWRSAVSAAFFIELEFQNTGSFVYRFYKASYGTRPAYAQFTLDRARVVDSPDLEQNKQNFAELWVQRPEFTARYSQTSSCADFTDALVASVRDGSGVDLSARRFELIGECNTYAGDMKAQHSRVLRKLVEYPEFVKAEYNRAFVLMQYFGYLQREPDQGGYDFWLSVVNNSVPNDPSGYRSMVCAFITSAEYQQRFSGVVTRNDSVCAPQ